MPCRMRRIQAKRVDSRRRPLTRRARIRAGFLSTLAPIRRAARASAGHADSCRMWWAGVDPIRDPPWI